MFYNTNMNAPHGLSQINAFYGVPYTSSMHENSAWVAENIVSVELPFPLRCAWALHTSVNRIEFHKKAADALVAALSAIYAYARSIIKKHYGYDETTAFYDKKTLSLLQTLGLDIWGGSYNFRAKRGLHEVSCHSYGIAIDMDPDHNPLQSSHFKLKTTFPKWYIECFKAQGFTWGGDWHGRRDAMHFQLASGY